MLLLGQKNNFSSKFKFEPITTNNLWFVVKMLWTYHFSKLNISGSIWKWYYPYRKLSIVRLIYIYIYIYIYFISLYYYYFFWEILKILCIGLRGTNCVINLCTLILEFFFQIKLVFLECLDPLPTPRHANELFFSFIEEQKRFSKSQNC